jgi:ATP-dependent Clp protease ATP-binding subunit ClpC
LTEQVRRKPYSVVLFDEIEKAHPDVFHLLLQILEDGTLTDSRGRRVDFSNTVIIMTSNVGASDILEPRRLGFSAETSDAVEYERMKDSVRQALERTFPPEFLNRIDEIITFGRLTEKDLTEIAARMLAEVTKRIAALGITIRFSGEVAQNLARAGADPRYGARPLRRTLVRRIEDTFSEELLAGRIRAGDSVEAVWDGDGVRYLCGVVKA